MLARGLRLTGGRAVGAAIVGAALAAALVPIAPPGVPVLAAGLVAAACGATR